MTRPRKDVETVRELLGEGLKIAEITRRVGVSRWTVRNWMTTGFDNVLHGRLDSSGEDVRCDFCPYVRDLSETSYAYLLGLYLGDGYIASHPRGVYRLRIFQDNKYPFLIHQCAIAMNWVIPSRIGFVQKDGCIEIASASDTSTRDTCSRTVRKTSVASSPMRVTELASNGARATTGPFPYRDVTQSRSWNGGSALNRKCPERGSNPHALSDNGF
jgi:hypothetical protein